WSSSFNRSTILDRPDGDEINKPDDHKQAHAKPKRLATFTKRFFDGALVKKFATDKKSNKFGDQDSGERQKEDGKEIAHLYELLCAQDL
ncbi:hypothetical protein JXA02_06390, partial [candidate division KSB1 bacterium]|nr:hypothetical protein [candidate division KSB1 bacterium]